MDITKITDWVIGSLIVGILLIVTNIISIIRAGKMMPKELKGAELSNKEAEIDIVSKMDATLSNSIERALNLQSKLDDLDKKLRDQNDEICDLGKKIESQNDIIKIQGDKIIALEHLSKSQKEEIDLLTTEVNNYSLWTNALVDQLQNVDLKPIKMEDVEGIDLSIRKKISKKDNNN